MSHDMSGTRGRILVVDDEELNRILLFANLEEAGYAVGGAEDGEAALAELRAVSYDAVLLDLIMPRMDGYEVLRLMKQDAGLRRIPVIVISSTDEMESIVRCLEMGATDYLTKPFDPALLHARIRGSLASMQEERMAVLREQFAKVTVAQEEERKRIARELHDGLVPNLATLSIRLHTVGKQLLREGHPLAAEIDELASQAQASSRDTRRLIHDLRPAALDELGLVPALREALTHCEREHGIAFELTTDVAERLPAPVETALFRIAQEAVNNVLRHARASRARVILERDDDHVRLEVADDGQGFDVQLPRSGVHVGLWSMRERVEQLGGRFEVRSVPGQGARVIALVPL